MRKVLRKINNVKATLIILSDLHMDVLSCSRRVFQGSTNVSFQRRVLCVHERVQNVSCVTFPGIFTITAVKT